MGTYRTIIKGSRTWQGTGLVLSAMFLPLSFVLWLEPGTRSVAGIATVVGVSTYPVLLAVGVGSYVAWRITSGRNAGFLAAVSITLAVQGFAAAGVRRSFGDQLSDWSAGLVALEVVFWAVTALVLWLGADHNDRTDPALLGFTAGALCVAAALAVPSLRENPQLSVPA